MHMNIKVCEKNIKYLLEIIIFNNILDHVEFSNILCVSEKKLYIRLKGIRDITKDYLN